jgi:hypothetical protein
MPESNPYTLWIELKPKICESFQKYPLSLQIQDPKIELPIKQSFATICAQLFPISQYKSSETPCLKYGSRIIQATCEDKDINIKILEAVASTPSTPLQAEPSGDSDYSNSNILWTRRSLAHCALDLAFETDMELRIRLRGSSFTAVYIQMIMSEIIPTPPDWDQEDNAIVVTLPRDVGLVSQTRESVTELLLKNLDSKSRPRPELGDLQSIIDIRLECNQIRVVVDFQTMPEVLDMAKNDKIEVKELPLIMGDLVKRYQNSQDGCSWDHYNMVNNN